MPACRSEETQEKLAQCLTSLRCRLRVRCHCAECVAVSKSRDHRTPRGGSKHLAAMVLKETEDTNQTAANPTNQKVSCVATLPIPAGGFCRRSAAVQLMLAPPPAAHRANRLHIELHIGAAGCTARAVIEAAPRRCGLLWSASGHPRQAPFHDLFFAS